MNVQDKPRKSKKRKFKVHKIPRYLPGSVQNAVLIQDLQEYNKHRYKVLWVYPTVDVFFLLIVYYFPDIYSSKEN